MIQRNRRMEIADAKARLLASARKSASVTCDMVLAAFRLSVPIALVWAAAGAGLADYHVEKNIRVDLRHEFGKDAKKIPQEFFDGYDSALRAGELARQFQAVIQG